MVLIQNVFEELKRNAVIGFLIENPNDLLKQQNARESGFTKQLLLRIDVGLSPPLPGCCDVGVALF